MRIRWKSKDLGGKMKDKPFWKSKTVYAGLIIAAYGILSAVGIDLTPYKEIIITLASGLGIIGIRSAIGNNKK